MVLFSVIMPSYNHAKYLPETITSVLNQTIRDFELIIIDDCSSDNSRGIIEKFKDIDGRIISIFHETNKGIGFTCNDGLKNSKGKFISFIDSDDVWNRNFLEKVLEILEIDDNLIVWTEGELIDSRSKSLGVKYTQYYHSIDKKKSGNLFLELFQGCFILNTGFTLKRESLGDIRFDDQFILTSNYQFYVDLAEKYDYYFIENILVKYRLYNKNSADLYPDILAIEIIKLRKNLLEQYKNKIPVWIRWRYHHFEIFRFFLILFKRKKSFFISFLLYIFELIFTEISFLAKRRLFNFRKFFDTLNLKYN